MPAASIMCETFSLGSNGKPVWAGLELRDNIVKGLLDNCIFVARLGRKCPHFERHRNIYSYNGVFECIEQICDKTIYMMEGLNVFMIFSLHLSKSMIHENENQRMASSNTHTCSGRQNTVRKKISEKSSHWKLYPTYKTNMYTFRMPCKTPIIWLVIVFWHSLPRNDRKQVTMSFQCLLGTRPSCKWRQARFRVSNCTGHIANDVSFTLFAKPTNAFFNNFWSKMWKKNITELSQSLMWQN